jgi:hypothetical protein
VHGDWQTFFLAQVGATAALTGLVFVALSINLGEVLAEPQLIERAGEAVVLLVEPVLLGLLLLMPYSVEARGFVVALLAMAFFVMLTRLLFRGGNTGGRPAWEYALRVGMTELAAVPPVLGAVFLIAGSDAGYGFLALGGIVSIGVGILNGWVLLIEIKR